jgi:hypothetical protein
MEDLKTLELVVVSAVRGIFALTPYSATGSQKDFDDSQCCTYPEQCLKSVDVLTQDGGECRFKVKTTTPFAKMFNGKLLKLYNQKLHFNKLRHGNICDGELNVTCLLTAYAKKHELNEASIRFLYDGQRLRGDQTPGQVSHLCMFCV